MNTSGVFKGFYKNQNGIGQFGGSMSNALQRITAPITLPQINLSKYEREVSVSQLDAQVFIEQLGNVDVAYLDPPYNQHPYGSNYFMLNLIADYREPETISRVSGIPKEWNRSSFNVRSKALEAFSSLIQKCQAKWILVSYSSEGFISKNEMLSLLEGYGEVSIHNASYPTFRGCRNLKNRPNKLTEFLFIVRRRN